LARALAWPDARVYYELVPLATLRSLRNDEIEAAVSLFAESANDMAQRHGVGIRVLPPQHDGIARAYGHIARTGIFRVAVAESDGRIVALACAIVRGPWWFLSSFWALPGLQGRGIGGPLLDEAMRQGERAGARVFFTWSSVDPRAMATYLRRDLLPGWPILVFTVDAKAAGTIPSADPAGYELVELDGALVSGLAKAAGHPPRDEDHAFWRETSTARAVARQGEIVGYFYARPGSVGPLAWTDDAHAPAVLDSALAAVSAPGGTTRVNVPGVAHAAIRHLLTRGAQLVSFGHLLATQPPGEMTRYVPSGPLLF
jgi:GNAT superfamily N-acetyltransferase